MTKKGLLIFLFLILSTISFSQNEFITTWETTTANESITIPTTGNGYNYAVYWGDGTLESNITGDATHTYATAGTYRVQITGNFPRIYFNASGDKDKIQTIEQWGNIEWTSMGSAFRVCKNLQITATDAPNLSNVTSMINMFRGASSLNSNINHWNVGNVIDMSYVFAGARIFNQPLNDWDVSNVILTSFMFGGATSFNQPLNDWNVSNVTGAEAMFAGAYKFNQSLNNWDVSTVIYMNRMFQYANAFDQDLSTWDISSVTNMPDMFEDVGLSTANYDTTLIGWATLNTANGETQIPTNIDFNGGSSNYCLSVTQRQELIDTYNWTITDGGLVDCDFTNAFITTWETTTANETITIPTLNTGYDYVVDWGDGTVDYTITGDASHTYTTAGTYTVKIIGDFPRIYFNNTGDKNKIQSVEQWGVIVWKYMSNAFYGCSNLVINATDIPNTSETRYFNNMLRDVPNVAISFADWDLSSTINMADMFTNSGLSTENYDATLIGWATLDTVNGETQIPANINFNGGSSQYCYSESQRQELIDTYGWNITDSGLDSSCSNTVAVSPKVYLQGAYLNPNTGEETLMRDDLREGNYIPTATPYTDGLTCDASVFNTTGNDAIVDWIWVELRDATDNTVIIEGQSALLQRDGDVVDVDGVSPLSLNQSSGDYYVVIKHRNHIGIMTVNLINLSATTTVVDLSSDPTEVLGGATSLVDMNGIYAMYGGDFSGEGQIQNADLLNIYSVIGTSGYSDADLDMNNQIQNSDVFILLPNIGKGIQF